jgi:hypothetical protein
VARSEYLVELYLARGDGAAVAASAERTRLTAEELSAAGTPVRYLRSIFVPEDETCFLLCEAESAEAVRDAAERAGLRFERVVEVAPQSTGDVGSRATLSVEGSEGR